jgi:fatty acid desaturase
MEGYGDASISNLEAIVSDQGWVRQWRILIWSWTLYSEGDYCFVEIARHRFLGYDEVRRYSRTLWMVMVAVMFIAVVAGAISVVALVLMMDAGGEASLLLALTFLPLVLGSAVVVYFTFVPPKEYRSSHKV